MKSKKTVLFSLLIFIGIILVVNILASRFFFRLDFTEDNRYTLSDATLDILSSLESPVTVTAYFSKDLPAAIEKARNDFKELLVEYNQRSNGMVLYEFIDPSGDEGLERKAMSAGVMPRIVNVREKDKFNQQKAYFGALIRVNEGSEAIPIIEPDVDNEYALSSGIKKLSVLEKPIIGILQGHGEPALDELSQVYNALSVLYDVEPITLDEPVVLAEKYKTIAIVAPKDTIPPSHLSQIADFLSNGGNLFIGYNRVKGNFSQARGTGVYTGLEDFLMKFGVVIDENFVVDWKCGSVMLQQQNYQIPVAFHYFPQVQKFEEHPVTKGIESIVFQFASSITFRGDTSIQFTPLIKTSENSGTINPPHTFDIEKKWGSADFPLSNITIGALLSGKLFGAANSRVILISDGDFPIGGKGRNAGQLPADNINLIVNSIDWLSDDTGLIDLRTKGLTSRPLDELEDGTRMLLKYFNFLFPIIIVVVYGFIRMQLNRNIRMKRMQESYV